MWRLFLILFFSGLFLHCGPSLRQEVEERVIAYISCEYVSEIELKDLGFETKKQCEASRKRTISEVMHECTMDFIGPWLSREQHRSLADQCVLNWLDRDGLERWQHRLFLEYLEQKDPTDQ